MGRGRPKRTSDEERRIIKARENLNSLIKYLKEERGISQRELCRRMFPGNEMSDDKVGYLNRILRGKVKSITTEYVKRICDAINSYPCESERCDPYDIRWQWLAGIDDYRTYQDEHMARLPEHVAEFKAEIEKAAAAEKERLDKAPSNYWQYVLRKRGLQMVTTITAPSSPLTPCYSINEIGQNKYVGETIGKELIKISDAERTELQNYLDSYADYLIEMLIRRKTSENKQ